MRPSAAIAAVTFVCALGFGACATPGYDANKLQRQLVDAGLTSEQARCVTKGLEAKFDVNQLASISEPRFQKEYVTTRAVLTACKVKNLKPLP